MGRADVWEQLLRLVLTVPGQRYGTVISPRYWLGLFSYWLGSSNIVASDMAKGFAVTLIIGVAVSMFTAITVTRTFLRPFVGTGLAQQTSLFAPYQRKEKCLILLAKGSGIF